MVKIINTEDMNVRERLQPSFWQVVNKSAIVYKEIFFNILILCSLITIVQIVLLLFINNNIVKSLSLFVYISLVVTLKFLLIDAAAFHNTKLQLVIDKMLYNLKPLLKTFLILSLVLVIPVCLLKLIFFQEDQILNMIITKFLGLFIFLAVFVTLQRNASGFKILGEVCRIISQNITIFILTAVCTILVYFIPYLLLGMTFIHYITISNMDISPGLPAAVILTIGQGVEIIIESFLYIFLLVASNKNNNEI